MTDIPVNVPIRFVDRLTGPMKKALRPAEALSGAVARTEDQLKRLGRDRTAVRQFQALKRSSESTGRQLDDARQKASRLAREFAQAEAPTKKMADSVERARRSVRRLSDAQQSEQRQLQESRRRLDAAGISTRNLAADTRRLDQALRQSTDRLQMQNRQLDSMRTRQERMARARARQEGFQSAAGGLAVKGAAATGVAFGAQRLMGGFTNAIRPLERAKGELATVGVENLDLIASVGRDMQMKYAGVTSAAFVSASYDIKSGISSLTDEGVAAVTASAVTTAKATKASADQMTSLFATSYGLFKGQFEQLTDAQFADRFGATLAKSVQQFKTDGGKMQQSIESAGAFAANMGMGMEEQMAVLGMMQTSMQAGEAGTSLRAFASASAGANDAFEGLAKHSDNPVRVRILDENNMLRSMPDILADLRARYGETLDAVESAEIKKAFGTEEAVKLIATLYGQEEALAANSDALRGAADAGADFTEEMAKAADNNFDATMVLMGQKVDVLKQKIGDRLIPIFDRLSPKFDAIVDGLFTWIDANPKLVTTIGATIAVIGGIAAVAAPVLFALSGISLAFGAIGIGAAAVTNVVGGTAGLLLRLVGGAGSAGKGLTFLGRRALPLVGKALLFVGRALLANPIGLAITAIAGGAYLIWKNWEAISSWFSDLWSKVTRVFSRAWSGIKQLFLNYHPIGLIYRHWDAITGFFGRLWGRVRSGISTGWEGIKSLFLNYHPIGLIIKHWDTIVGTFAGYWASIKDGAARGWDRIKAILALFTPQGVKDAWSGVTQWFADLWGGIFDFSWSDLLPDWEWPKIEMLNLGELISWPEPPAWMSRLMGGDKDSPVAGPALARPSVAAAPGFAEVPEAKRNAAATVERIASAGPLPTRDRIMDLTRDAVALTDQIGEVKRQIDQIGDGPMTATLAQPKIEELRTLEAELAQVETEIIDANRSAGELSTALRVLSETAVAPEISTASIDAALAKTARLAAQLRTMPGAAASGPSQPQGQVQARAMGGSYAPGWLMTGERGPELRYERKGGFIAHNQALKRMVGMSREIAGNTSGRGSATSAIRSAVSTVGSAAGAAASISFSPSYSIPITVSGGGDAGVDVDGLRRMMADEMDKRDRQAQAALRRMLHDR